MRRIQLLFLLLLGLTIQGISAPVIQIINASSDPFMGFVKVELGDSVIIDTLRINEGTTYFEVPEGAGQTLRFTALLDNSAVFELTDITFEDGKKYQTILYGFEDDSLIHP